MGEIVIGFQLANTFLFLFGVILGENICTKVFGIPKKKMFFLEILIFVFVSVLSVNFVTIANEMLQYPLSFFMGFISITTARAFSSSFGYYSIKKKGEYVPKRDMNNIVFNLIRNLKEGGMSYKKIEQILKKSGFNKKMVDKWVASLKRRIK